MQGRAQHTGGSDGSDSASGREGRTSLALEETVSCGQFEDLIRDLIEKTHNPIQAVMDDSGIGREELELVLLVGGSTRIPAVARDIEAFL